MNLMLKHSCGVYRHPICNAGKATDLVIAVLSELLQFWVFVHFADFVSEALLFFGVALAVQILLTVVKVSAPSGTTKRALGTR